MMSRGSNEDYRRVQGRMSDVDGVMQQVQEVGRRLGRVRSSQVRPGNGALIRQAGRQADDGLQGRESTGAQRWSALSVVGRSRAITRDRRGWSA